MSWTDAVYFEQVHPFPYVPLAPFPPLLQTLVGVFPHANFIHIRAIYMEPLHLLVSSNPLPPSH
jgi:hypothetical protein